MPGSFAGLNTALSALNYNRVAMDVAGGNIANVSTEGYTRRRVEGASVGGPTTPAMWSRYDGHGDGVRVSGVNRMSDELLNTRSRREHGTQAYLDVRQASLERVENGVGEPGDAGVSAALKDFRASFAQLAISVSTKNDASRTAVISSASGVVDALRAQRNNIAGEAADQRVRLVGDVAEVNTVATDLAGVNAAIVAGRNGGNDVGVLLDKRDSLTLRLSTLTGATSAVQADGSATVSLGGAVLVEGRVAKSLVITSGVDSDGTADGAALSFSVDGTGTSSPVTVGAGEIGGVVTLLDETLPSYLDGLAQVASQFATEVNDLHTQGYDRDGNPGEALFDFDPSDVLNTLQVAITDPSRVAASSVPGANTGTGTADQLAKTSGVEGAYQRLVTNLGIQVNQAQRQSTNQSAVTSQVDSAREQLGGVNLDEEMVNMLAAQRAYESASRLMTTLDSVLDTLINRTGLTH